MDTSISVRMFEWRGDVWISVDRVGRAGHRKHAPRTPLVSIHSSSDTPICEDVALLWLQGCLTEWVAAGCPRGHREAVSAPPQGATGVVSRTGVPPQLDRSKALPSQTEPAPVEHRGSEATSDPWVDGTFQPALPGMPGPQPLLPHTTSPRCTD
jgi:hypothetical protein